MFPRSWRWSPRRTPEQQIALATRVLQNRHEADIYDRARASLGDRVDIIGPIDLHRNPLVTKTDQVARAHWRPPFVTGLPEDLARLMGDASASTLIARYAKAGGRPMPTTLIAAAHEALRYRWAVGYAGIRLGWSRRERRLLLPVIGPDDMELEWSDDSPTEPTIIRARAEVRIDEGPQEAVEVYDLSDLDNPSYRVMVHNADRTADIHGQTFEGADYWWRYEDGRPFHRIVMTGHNRDPYRTLALVEAALIVAVRWTTWGSGVDHASHPQRNVRGMEVPTDSETGNGQGVRGVAVGPESVIVWHDIDPERPGTHWQDAPAFDPEVIGRAIRLYEASAMSSLGLPMDLEGTGGEPSARELEALDEEVVGTYPECRRFESEVVRRLSAVARHAASEGWAPEGDYAVTEPVGLLYRDEMNDLFKTEEGENGREPGSGRPGREAAGPDREGDEDDEE